MQDYSPCNSTYATLYRECAHCFLNTLRGVPKPKSSLKSAQYMPQQKTFCKPSFVDPQELGDSGSGEEEKEELDWERKQLITKMQGLFIHNHMYATLYRRCICIFPNTTEELCKPEPEPVQDTPLQQTAHNHQTWPAPLSPTCTPFSP